MIVRTFVLAILVCVTLSGHCQQARQAPQPTPPLDGSARIAELLEKATEFIEVDNDSARHYASMGRQLASDQVAREYLLKLKSCAIPIADAEERPL